MEYSVFNVIYKNEKFIVWVFDIWLLQLYSLRGAPELSISKFQRVQNALARIVLQKNSATPASLLFNSLHWHPVHSRINFKIATITYKSLHPQSPGYLASMLHHYIPTRNLRSSNWTNSLLLSPHPAKTNFGLHAFQSTAPNIWNKLPIDVKSACSISSFKVHLKTHYFQHTSWLVTWPRTSDLACARYINSYSHCHCHW